MSNPQPRRRWLALLTALVAFALIAASCAEDDPIETTTDDPVEETTESTDDEMAEDDAPAEATTFVRDSGLTVTVQPAGDHTVHTVLATEDVFANATHIIETDNSLVLIDTQFLLPNALDFRAYADSLGKPIDRVFITHVHPDHFLGSEAFNDLPIYALQEVSDAIAEVGDAEVAEKQADFGPDLIASSFVVPEIVEEGTLVIDGVTYELSLVVDAEAPHQLVIRMPELNTIAVGDIVYSGVHLIMAGAPDTWTVALEGLQADSDDYPIVLPGHGVVTDPSAYDRNIAWLAEAASLLGTAETGEEFKTAMVEAFPDRGMDAAIDFILPAFFPEEPAEEAAAEPTTFVRDSGMTITVQQAGDYTIHTALATEDVFANATHIIETDNSLVLVDTQFLLPNALDFRAYADSLGKPIDRVFITHEHPDHFLGSEAFNDVPIYAIQEVSDAIAEVGDAEVAEKQADFGPDLIASSFVVPEIVEEGTLTIDGLDLELSMVVDAEAPFQLVIRIPDAGAIVTGDIVYSGVHLIMAGAPDTWTVALEGLQADSDQYPIVLPGHGVATDPSAYDRNIAWLAKAAELLGTAETGEEFKTGMVEAFPDRGMDAAIDFIIPAFFPEG